MRFLVDAQLPPALARRLEAWGHAAQHVADVGMAAGSDHQVRDYAARIGADRHERRGLRRLAPAA